MFHVNSIFLAIDFYNLVHKMDKLFDLFTFDIFTGIGPLEKMCIFHKPKHKIERSTIQVTV